MERFSLISYLSVLQQNEAYRSGKLGTEASFVQSIYMTRPELEMQRNAFYPIIVGVKIMGACKLLNLKIFNNSCKSNKCWGLITTFHTTATSCTRFTRIFFLRTFALKNVNTFSGKTDSSLSPASLQNSYQQNGINTYGISLKLISFVSFSENCPESKKAIIKYGKRKRGKKYTKYCSTYFI